MSFLLDTDICSAYLKNDRTVVSKVMLHFGSLNVSVISLGELLTWAMRASAPPSRLQGVRDLLRAATLHDVVQSVAEKFGEVRAGLMDRGVSVGAMDLLNAAVALIHDFTMVTNNVGDYAHVPGLRVENWQIP
jgi:predicted nucleic acid-binding protein